MTCEEENKVIQTCTHCNGKGYIQITGYPCPSCNGKGYNVVSTADYERIEELKTIFSLNRGGKQK